MVRTFIAIDIEDENVVQGIVSFQRELVKYGKFKIVKPENLHITLKFLGEVDPSKIGIIAEVLDNIETDTFEICFRGLGCFPSPARPNVVWVGVSEDNSSLLHIWSYIEDQLQKYGFQRERRGFKPHLTIARVKFISDRQGFRNLIYRYRGFELGVQKVSSIKLKKSVLTPTGPVYSDLHVKAF